MRGGVAREVGLWKAPIVQREQGNGFRGGFGTSDVYLESCDHDMVANQTRGGVGEEGVT
jgi:hypothetical protein